MLELWLGLRSLPTDCIICLLALSRTFSLIPLVFCVLRLSAEAQHMCLLVLVHWDECTYDLPIQMWLINLINTKTLGNKAASVFPPILEQEDKDCIMSRKWQAVNWCGSFKIKHLCVCLQFTQAICLYVIHERTYLLCHI